MSGETLILAEYVAGLRYDEIPKEVVERGKALTLDLLGSAIRARSEADSTPSLIATVEALGIGEGGATVMADPRRYSLAAAALLNGALGHSLDFDDTHAESSLHPSAPVVPAALAAGELVNANGREVLAAIVAGYEVACRLGNALNPTAHYARGFHPTATAGTFGAAAAAAVLLRLPAGQVSSAFGVAASQAAGSLQFLINGAWNKRYQVGASSMNGLTAALLARNGFIGASEAIEGRHGFLKAYSDAPDVTRAIARLGSDYETLKIAVKPYPSCRYTHAALDALIALRRELGLRSDEVEHVEIGLHRNGITLTGYPEEAKRRPRSVVDGQFSMHVTAAFALEQGSFGWDDYRRLGDPRIEEICDRIRVVQDDAVEAASPHPFGGRVTIHARGEIVTRLIPDPSGEPESFPSPEMVRNKFLQLAEPVLPNTAAAFADTMLSLETLGPVGDVLALARPDTAKA